MKHFKSLLPAKKARRLILLEVVLWNLDGYTGDEPFLLYIKDLNVGMLIEIKKIVNVNFLCVFQYSLLYKQEGGHEDNIWTCSWGRRKAETEGFGDGVTR